MTCLAWPRAAGRATGRRGYTLVELVAAMVILSMVMLALGSTVLLATKALPEPGGAVPAPLQAAGVIDDFATPLRYAIAVTERAPMSVTFTVAEYNAPSAEPVTVRLAWSGMPGEPLTRQIDGGTPVVIAQDVRAFDLVYHTQVAVERISSTVESAETTLSSHSLGLLPRIYDVRPDKGLGTYFKPVLPLNATNWKVTRVKFRARSDDPIEDVLAVRLHLPQPGSHLPRSSFLAEQLVDESSMTTTLAWHEVVFNAGNLSPDRGLCLVMLGATDGSGVSGGGVAAEVPYETVAVGSLLTTGDGGLSWSESILQSMGYYVYGTYSTPGPTEEVERTYLTSIDITLQTGGDAAGASFLRVPLRNRPEVSP